MIPQNLADFVQGPVVLAVGTRSDGLMPTVTYGRGAVVDAGNDVITVIVPDVESEATFANLEHNGVIALSAADGVSHETYQFKGRCLDVGPSDEHQRAIEDVYTRKMIGHYAVKGIPDEYFGDYTLYPSTAIRFRVEEVFAQTPGPGAGRKLDLASGETAS